MIFLLSMHYVLSKIVSKISSQTPSLNISTRLRFVSERADSGETLMAIAIPEKTGENRFHLAVEECV